MGDREDQGRWKEGNEMGATGLLTIVTQSRPLSQAHLLPLAGNHAIKHSPRMPFRGCAVSPLVLCEATSVTVQTCGSFPNA